MRWRDAVLQALHSYCHTHRTRVVERQTFIHEQLKWICTVTSSTGATPAYTLSRHLQELRDAGSIEFLSRGSYLLLDDPIDIEEEDLSDEAIDLALRANRLRLGEVETDSTPAVTRRRKGQARIRELITGLYEFRCAVCDVADVGLLIASHVVGWAEAPEHRGNLANVICLCRPHDALFEAKYWSLGDDLTILRRGEVSSRTIRFLLDEMAGFRRPTAFAPAPEFVKIHRMRAGFQL